MSFNIPICYSEIEWQVPSIGDLAAHELTVWKITTDHFHNLYPAYKMILSADEIDRAERFHQPKDAQLFLTGIISLRLLLSDYLKIDAAGVQFKRGQYGKPALLDHYPPLHFNLSHSGAVVLIAFSLMDVGVDVEQVNPNFNFDPLLENVFTHAERSYLHENPEDSIRRFYLLWTRKESMAKHTGKGLHENMNTFSVLDGNSRDTAIHLNLKKPIQISSFSLSILPHYIASTCYDTKITSVRFNDFSLRALNRKTERLFNPCHHPL